MSDITPSMLNRAFKVNLDAKFTTMVELVRKTIDASLTSFIRAPKGVSIQPAYGGKNKFSITINHGTCNNVLPTEEVMEAVMRTYRDAGFNCSFDLIDGDRSYDYYMVSFYESN